MEKNKEEDLFNQEILPYLKDLQMEDCKEYVKTVKALCNFLIKLESDGKLTEDDVIFIAYLTSQIRINTISHLKNKMGKDMIEKFKKAVYGNL